MMLRRTHALWIALVTATGLLPACGATETAAANLPPIVIVSEPSDDVALQVTAGGTVDIEYTDADANGAASTDIIADQDGDLSTTADQVVVEAGRPAGSAVLQVVTWNVQGAAPGTYRIFARTSDGIETAIAEALGTVTLTPQPLLEITSPDVDVTLSRGGLLPIDFVDRGPASGTTTLFADGDGDLDTDLDQEVVASLPAAGAQSFLWDSTGSGLTDLSILGTSVNGPNPAVRASATGRVRIDSVALVRALGQPVGSIAPGIVQIFAVDASPTGRIAVAGTYEQTPVLGAGEANETTLPPQNVLQNPLLGRPVFVALFEADATLAWVRTGQANSNSEAMGVTMRADGSVLMTGNVGFSSFVLDPGGADETALASVGVPSILIACFEPDGALRFVREIGELNRSSTSRDVSAQGDGSFFITGRTQGGPITFGRGEPNETVADGSMYVAHYAADGALNWVRAVTTVDNPLTSPTGTGVSSAPGGGVYVTGSYFGTATFGTGEPNETTLDSGAGSGIFLARYESDGALAWVRGVSNASTRNRAHEVETLSDGSSVIVGQFEEIMVFGAGNPNAASLGSFGDRDIYVARYLPDGTFAWAHRRGGANRDGDGFFNRNGGLGTAALIDGSFVLVSTFNTGLFGPRAPFAERFALDGSTIWLEQRSGTSATDVASLPDGSTVVVGGFDSGTTFGAGDPGETILLSGGPGASYIARYNADGGF